MKLTLSDSLVARTANEGSAVAFALKVYSDAYVLTAPTTIRYRVDDLDTGEVVAGWTTVSPASSATITVTGAQNTLTDCHNARRQLTVQTDVGLSTVAVATREFNVRALGGVSA